MSTLDIDLIMEPFPHMIIRDTFDEQELALIWRELEFLNSPYKMKRPDRTGTAVDMYTGMPLSNNFSLFLNDCYKDKNISDILRINEKILDPAIRDAFSSLSPLVGHIKSINYYSTLLRYYETGEYYRGHQDTARFTAISYFYKEPKSFSGGDLHFDEYDYTIPIENNSTVVFVGSCIHSTTELKMPENVERFSGFGRYAMTQFLYVKEKETGELT